MSTINNGVKQNDIKDSEVSKLADSLYENLFNVNVIDNKEYSYYFYNTLNKIDIPEELASDVYTYVTLTHDTPWTTLAHRIYNDMTLWWLIVLINRPDYIFKAKGGLEYKIIKPEVIDFILDKINA